MTDPTHPEANRGKTERSVPDLLPAYQSARLQIVITASLLILWRMGISFEGSIPLLGVKILASEKLPYVLCVVLGYGVLRLAIEWFQSDVVRRRRFASRADLAVTLGIAGVAGWLTLPKLVASIPLPRPWLILPLALLASLGLYAGWVTAGLLGTVFWIRSKEQAARLALPRYPVVTRAMFKWWCHLVALVVVVVLLAPGFAPPLSHLWFWFLGVPLGVPILSEAISLARPRRRAALKRHQAAVDRHDTSYQQGGWDKPIASNDAPLYLAAESGDLEQVDRLLERGRKPNQSATHGWTPLAIAVANGHQDVARLLLRHGADPNSANLRGRTPLMFAAMYGFDGLVADLIAVGADVNLNPSADAGPLAAAVGAGRVNVVNLLLNAGADVSRRDREGKTALDHAHAAGHGEIAAVLRKVMQQQAARPQ